MNLKGGEIARYLARPDPSRPALLIYGQDAMRVGDVIGTLYIETDGDRRKLHFIAYAGEVYVFVYKHQQDPGALERMTNGVTAWHGACLIRLR